MKNSAVSRGFSVDPCPRDLLGQQLLFMHMSSHYRRMYAAQSVVDSAPPRTFRTKDHVHSSGRTPSKNIKINSKPSRADTDPGHFSRHHAEYASIQRKAMGMPRLKRSQRNKAGTFLAKLDQLAPDASRTSSQLLADALTPGAPHKPQVLRSEVQSRLRSSSLYCPPRPKQSLRMKIDVNAKDSRPGPDAATSWMKPQLSPPGSSRDSAYNGGISSGGESRGQTPEQRLNAKKPGKKPEKKLRKKADRKTELKKEMKKKKQMEESRKNEMVERERQELRVKKVLAVPWHDSDYVIENEETRTEDSSQDRYSLKNPDSQTEEESHDDDDDDDGSQSEVASQTDDGSQTEDSIEEDMNEEEHDKEEDDEEEDDDDDDMASVEETKVKSQQSQSSAQTETQTTAVKLSQSSQSSTQPQLGSGYSSKVATESPSHSKSTLSTNKSMQSSKSSSTSPVSVSASVHSCRSEQRKLSVTQPQASLHSTLSAGIDQEKTSSKIISVDSDSHVGVKRRVSTSFKSVGVQAESNMVGMKSHKIEPQLAVPHDCACKNHLGVDNPAYTRLVYAVTEDVCARGIVTNRALKAVFREHIIVNQGSLNMECMQQVLDKLRIQLGIPKDDHLDNINYGLGLTKEGSFAHVPCALDCENFTPLISRPSDLLVAIPVHEKQEQKKGARMCEPGVKTPLEIYGHAPGKTSVYIKQSLSQESTPILDDGFGDMEKHSDVLGSVSEPNSDEDHITLRRSSVIGASEEVPHGSQRLLLTVEDRDKTENHKVLVRTDDSGESNPKPEVMHQESHHQYNVNSSPRCHTKLESQVSSVEDAAYSCKIEGRPEGVSLLLHPSSVDQVSPLINDDLGTNFNVLKSLTGTSEEHYGKVSKKNLFPENHVLQFQNAKEVAFRSGQILPSTENFFSETVTYTKEPACICSSDQCKCSSSDRLKAYMDRWMGGKSVLEEKIIASDLEKKIIEIVDEENIVAGAKTSENIASTKKCRCQLNEHRFQSKDCKQYDVQEDTSLETSFSETSGTHADFDTLKSSTENWKDESSVLPLRGNNESHKKMLVTLFSPQQPVLSNESVNEGMYEKEKMQKLPCKKLPPQCPAKKKITIPTATHCAPNGKLRTGPQNDGIANSDTEENFPDDSKEKEQDVNHIIQQENTSLPFGTGINSDVLRWCNDDLAQSIVTRIRSDKNNAREDGDTDP